MIREIYSHNPEDSDFNPSQMEVSSEYEAFLQQIRNCLFAKIGAIFGAPQMPVDLEQYIFVLGINTKELEKVITDALTKYCSLIRYFPTTVKVTYAKGNVRQIAYVDFVITGQRGFRIKMT